MNPRFRTAHGAMLAAAASICVLGVPAIAAAQSQGPNYDPNGYHDYNSQGGTYYDPCARAQADRSVVGGVLGAVAGATLGNSVTHGGAKLGGALIGGAVGAAAGAGIGHATAACDSGQSVPYAQGPYAQTDDRDYGPPPPPPPPPGAYVPPDDGRYADRDDRDDRSDYGPPPPPPPSSGEQCQMVEDRAFFPDGTTESSTVQACRDPRGHWRVVD